MLASGRVCLCVCLSPPFSGSKKVPNATMFSCRLRGSTLRPCLLRTTRQLHAKRICASPTPGTVHQLALLHLPGLSKAASVSPPSAAVLLSSSARLQSQATVIETAPPAATGASDPGRKEAGHEEPAAADQPTKSTAASEESGWLRFLLPLLDLGLLLAGALCTLDAHLAADGERRRQAWV